MSERRVINLDEVAVQENGNGQSFSAKIGRISPMLGSIGLGCTLTILPPGKRAFPFHRHHVTDEKFYIIDGSGELRLDDKVVPIRAGDLIANPAGKEAHQIVDNSKDELRYLAFSTIGTADIVDYPDSGKIAVGAGIKDADIVPATIRAVDRLTPTDYFDGEEPPKG